MLLEPGGGGGGTRPWWLPLLACGGAYWPLTLEPSAMTSRHPHCCGHPPALGGGGGLRVGEGVPRGAPPAETQRIPKELQGQFLVLWDLMAVQLLWPSGVCLWLLFWV